jgi:hypothetical protein
MRTAAGLLCAALVLSGLATPGAARAAAAVDFSVVPVGADRYFRFDARPGKTVIGRLRVISRSREEHRVVLRPVDVGTAATGGLDYGLGAPHAVGRWLTLSRSRVHLAPGAIVDVPFAAHLPQEARPGDHLAGLVAYQLGRDRDSAEQPEGLRVAFESRLAVAVQLRVPGPRHPRLAFRGASIVQSPSGVRIHLHIQNSGNTLVEHTRGWLVVSRAGHDFLETAVDLDSFAPDSDIRFPLLLPDGPVQGAYHLEGRLEPEGGPPVRIHTDLQFSDRAAARFEHATGRTVVRPAESHTVFLWGMLAVLFGTAVFLVAYRAARR